MSMTIEQATKYIQVGNRIQFLSIAGEMFYCTVDAKIPIPEAIFTITKIYTSVEHRVEITYSDITDIWPYCSLRNELVHGTAIPIEEDQGIYK